MSGHPAASRLADRSHWCRVTAAAADEADEKLYIAQEHEEAALKSKDTPVDQGASQCR